MAIIEKHISVEEEQHKVLKQLADKNNRSMRGQLAVIIKFYIENKDK